MENKQTQVLSGPERARGIKYLLRFAIFNGVGFGLLAETIIILIAVDFGASDFQVGYLSSVVQLAGITLLFLPGPLTGRSIIRTYFAAWLLRGLICLLYGLILFTNNNTSLWIIMVVYSLFCVSRITGIALFRPIQQMLSTSTTLGDLVTRNNIRYNASLILGKFISFALFSFALFSNLHGYLLLLMLGVIFNTIASLFLLKIPARQRIQASCGQNIFTLLVQGFKAKSRRIPMLLQWSNQVNMIASGFIIALLGQTVGMPKNIIFLYTMLTIFFRVIAGLSNKPFIDRLPNKPVLIITSALQIGFMLLWCLVNRTLPWYLIFLLGTAHSFLTTIRGAHSAKVVIQSFPARDKVGYNAMINFFTGVIAFGLGMGAGALGNIGRATTATSSNPYFLIFLAVAVVNFFSMILCFFLEEKRPLSVRDTLKIFSSISNLRAFLAAYKLDQTENPAKRRQILESIQYNPAPLATEEITKILNNPLAAETKKALKSLFVHPRAELLPSISDLAGDADSFHQETAVFVLGAYPGLSTEKLLIKLLENPAIRIRSTAAKSLARVGNTTALERVRQLSLTPELGAWDQMNYLIALSIMDKEGLWLQSIFKRSHLRPGKRYRQALLALVTRILEWNPKLEELYTLENRQQISGLKLLLEEAGHITCFHTDADKLLQLYTAHQSAAIHQWCLQQLRDCDFPKPFINLYQAMADHPPGDANRDNCLAMLVFTLQLVQKFA